MSQTMRMIRAKAGKAGGACALAALLLAPVTSLDARPPRHAKTSKLAADAPGFAAFTPAAADPRIAAAFARSGLGTSNFSAGAFRFTPSSNPASRRAITVAVRARSLNPAVADPSRGLALAAANSLAPSAYSLGASVGWKRFALSGDMAHIDGGLLPLDRESADIGVSFAGKRWATKVDLAGDRASGDHPIMIGLDQSWSVGLGGSYALTHNIDVSGGVRYKLEHDQLMSLLDDRRDSQAVYVGTTFRF